MELAVITFWQVVTLFLLIFTGVVTVKTGVITREAKSVFARLLLYVIVPMMTINSYLVEYSDEMSRSIGRAFLYSLFAILIGLAVSLLVHRSKANRNQAICRFGSTFANAAYMGFPLIQALFGAEGLVYASAYVTVFNVLLFTVGVGLVSDENTPRDILKNILKQPVIYAVIAGLLIYYLRIPVPQVLATAIGYLGGMNTPVSMMMTGILIAGSGLGGMLKNRQLWKTIAVRLLLVPAVCIGVFLALGIRGAVSQVVLLLEACPCAAITSVFAVQYHHEEDFAGALVVISTLLSIVTLPVCALLLTM
ncbi:MAG: AEC family transporter [Clostridia bacterium]|nr:AEC family transporter [Clostridia bacterium]